MNFSLSQAVNHSLVVRVSQFFEVGALMHHTFLCRAMTESPKNIFLHLSTVSRFRFLVPLQPTGYLPVKFWVDDLVLESPGSGCTRNELRDLLSGNNNFGVIRRQMFSIKTAIGNPCFLGAVNMELIAASTTLHITHGSETWIQPGHVFADPCASITLSDNLNVLSDGDKLPDRFVQALRRTVHS